MNEFQQPVRLGVLGTILRYGSQNRVSVVAHHGEFHQIGGIEHHIRVLLVRVDPFLLGLKHVRPLLNSLACGEGALVVVAHYPAQQTVVAGRDAVMVVKTDAGKGRNENPELAATLPKPEKRYVASYCAFAPADDPEIVVYVAVDEPRGESY